MKKGVQAIAGKTEVKVGRWENYSVTQWHEGTPQDKRNEASVTWELYHVDQGKPTLVLEKEMGHFRFQSRAIGEKFLITAFVYAPDLQSTSTMQVTVVDNEKPAILGVDITDISDKKLVKPLAKGQTINVHVLTVGMVGHHVTISLWEDEKDFTGKKTGKKKIVLEIPKRVGSKGIAHCQFVVPTDFFAIAKSLTGQGDQQVVYHVTAYALGLLHKTATTPPVDHEVRKAETKDKLEGVVKPKPNVPPVKRNVPIVTPKPATPAVPRTPQNPMQERDAQLKRITNLYFTNNKGKFIKEADYNSTIYLNIISTNLIGSTIKLTVKDKDLTDSDVLVKEKEYEITGNHKVIPIPLTADMQNTGGDIGYQNLYVDLVVLATSKHLVTTPINVDLKSTTYDPITNTTKFVIEDGEVEKKEEKGDCFCNRDITSDELKEMIVAMRKATSDESGENYYKWNKDNLFTSGHEKFKDKTYTKFSEVLNKTFNKYDINTCIRKIHFIAQCYEETGSFMRSVEGDTKTTYSYDPFRGRGFIQLTHRAGYKSFQEVSGYEVIDNPKLVSTDIEIAAMSSGWYWRDNTNKNGNINNWADNDDVWNISRLVNHPTATKTKGKINGLQNRKDATISLKKIFKYPQNCITKKDFKESDCKKDCICKSEVIVTGGFFINPKISINRVTVLEQDKFKEPLKLDGIILHRTVTKTTSSTISAFKGGRKNKKGKIIYYGTHFIVGKDGVITQTAHLDYKTNHCAGWNSKSVGIEVVGMPVDKDGNPTVKDSEIVTWEDLTEEQNKSVVCLLKLLLKYYGLTKSNLHCHEHEAPKTAGEGKVVLDAITPYL